MNVRVVGSLAAALLASAVCSSAESAEGDELLAKFVADVRTMSAHFEQQLVDENDVVVETSSGTVEISRPGRFRWAYAEPYEQVLVADGLNVWSYDVDLAQVTVKPQAQVLAATPAALLGGSAAVLEDFEYLDSVSERGTDWVVLRPYDPDSGFERVELGFKNGTLAGMIFKDNLQQSTVIALSDIVVNGEIDDSRFLFAPPADADLVGEPVVAESVLTPAATDRQ